MCLLMFPSRDGEGSPVNPTNFSVWDSSVHSLLLSLLGCLSLKTETKCGVLSVA